MGHFVAHVLSAPQFLGVDTNLLQEKLYSTQEVTQGLVVDNFLET